MTHVNKGCPTCKKNTISIFQDRISCSSCDFKVRYSCPVCDDYLEPDLFSEDKNGVYFDCPSCKKLIHTKKVAYLIENGLVVSSEVRCEFCNGPTVHRTQSNMGNRCFFFPKCSGQVDLFGRERESLVFLDFETTGLDASKNHIIEVGALKIDEEGFETTYQTFVNPPVSISPKITSITGITDNMVLEAPLIEPVIKALGSFIGSSKIVAHNADFDLPWLIIACEKYGVNLGAQKVLCTLKWAKKLSEPQKSLGALAKKYRIGHANAHRALADAATTKELYFIFEHQSSENQPVEDMSHYRSIVEKIMVQSQETNRF